MRTGGAHLLEFVAHLFDLPAFFAFNGLDPVSGMFLFNMIFERCLHICIK